MTLLDRSLEPDAEQVEAQRARTLLELVNTYTRAALQFPEEVKALRAITAELLFENAALRWQVEQLVERVDRLERRAGGGP